MSTPQTPSASDAEFTKALEVIPFGSHVYEFLTR
jgi:hypothetical protein